jgi:hypothetical protein
MLGYRSQFRGIFESPFLTSLMNGLRKCFPCWHNSDDDYLLISKDKEGGLSLSLIGLWERDIFAQQIQFPVIYSVN